MPNLSVPLHRLYAVVLAAVFGLGGALLLDGSPAAAAVATSDQLMLNWVDDGRHLEVSGFGYRPNDSVNVQLGDSTIERTRSDGTGQVKISVPHTLVEKGRSGVSIVVIGRSVSGSSRMLVSAVPPRAAVNGPVDVLPWSIGVVAVGAMLLGALARLRRRRAPFVAGAAPHGYTGRHAV
jgi:hypothetical protein